MSSESQPAQSCVKQEPGWDEETSGSEPRLQRPVSTKHVHIKIEAEFIKAESEWEDAGRTDAGLCEVKVKPEPETGTSDVNAQAVLCAAREVKVEPEWEESVRSDELREINYEVEVEIMAGPQPSEASEVFGNLRNAEMKTAGAQKASVSRQVYSVTNENVGETPGVKRSKTANITKGTTSYKCSRCSYASAYKSHLLVHERNHTGEKPYKCSQCSYASSQRCKLLRHERCVHTGEKPHKCSYCSFAYACKSNLLVHERKHTGEKPYKCNSCSFASAHKSLLLDHEKRKHTGERPYKCSHCSYASAQKGDLVIHERTHTGEKPYMCSHCSYSNNRKYRLLAHERKHTGEKPVKTKAQSKN